MATREELRDKTESLIEKYLQSNKDIFANGCYLGDQIFSYIADFLHEPTRLEVSLHEIHYNRLNYRELQISVGKNDVLGPQLLFKITDSGINEPVDTKIEQISIPLYKDNKLLPQIQCLEVATQLTNGIYFSQSAKAPATPMPKSDKK